MNRWALRVLSILGLLTVTGVALAAGTSPNVGVDPAVANHSDLSVAYLAQVFGTVGGTLQGTSGQMLGHLFYKFNQGILVVAGLWLSYLVFTTFLRSAQEGSFMNPNRNIVIILLRVALGFGLLLPNPATGYSIFQDVVMKVVVSGISLADETWRYGLQYVQDGGSVWREPEATGADGSSILTPNQALSMFGPTSTPAIGGKIQWSNLGMVQKVFLDEVCMYRSSMSNSQQTDSSNSSSLYNLNPAPANYHVIDNDKTKSFEFPGLGNATSNLKNEPACGSVYYGNLNLNSYKTGSDSGFDKQATSTLINELLPAAKQYVCQSDPTASGCGDDATDKSSSIANDFFGALVGYVNAIFPEVQENQSQGAAAAKNFIADAQYRGWMVAGRYYWDLARVGEHYSKVSNIESYQPEVNEAPILKNNSNTEVVNTMNSAGQQAGGYVAQALGYLGTYTGATNAGGSYTHESISGLPGSLALLLGPTMVDMGELIADFSATNVGIGTDPILFLHHVGMHAMAVAGDMYFSTAVILVLLMVVATFYQAVLNIATPIKAAANWIKPLLVGMATLLLGVGIILGYYVPLYPYMLFTFGVIGFIIRVLIGMVAAPLVCLALTHPEGHDFLGEAKQMLTLLLSLFIEPVLMIIGLIAGMIISYVALKIVVFTFSGFVGDLFYMVAPSPGSSGSILNAASRASSMVLGQAVEGGSLGGMIMSILAFPLFLVIFASMVYVVTNLSFSTIFELKNTVLMWIGGQSMPDRSAGMAQTVSGAMSQVGQGVGQASKQMMDNMHSSTNEKMSKRDNFTQNQQNPQNQNNNNNNNGNN